MFPSGPLIGSPEWHQDLDQYFAFLDVQIKVNGFVIQAVADGSMTYCYTVGLYRHLVETPDGSFGLPELFIAGLAPFDAHRILAPAAQSSLEFDGPPGEIPVTEDRIAKIVHGRSCHTRGLRCDILHQYYQDHVLVSQVVWPAENGAYPWDPAWPYDASVQPLLDAWSLTK